MSGLSDKLYQRGWLNYLLYPFSLLYRSIIVIRRWMYRRGYLQSFPAKVPVIVVGNISVGGTGKSPLTAWLVNYLKSQGKNPGIVSRGYGGKRDAGAALTVTANSDPAVVGDEAVMLVQQTQCPMVVSSDRAAAVSQLQKLDGIDLIVSDDGLQHYAMQRDIEIAVIDAKRGLQNGFCLPAGPLREPAARLNEVDFVISNGNSNHADYHMQIDSMQILKVSDPLQSLSQQRLKASKINALAGIGHPQRFFDLLTEQGLEFTPYIFPDHHRFVTSNIDFDDDSIVLMTEKDAVKCRSFADDRHWYVAITVKPDDRFIESIHKKIESYNAI